MSGSGAKQLAALWALHAQSVARRDAVRAGERIPEQLHELKQALERCERHAHSMSQALQALQDAKRAKEVRCRALRAEVRAAQEAVRAQANPAPSMLVSAAELERQALAVEAAVMGLVGELEIAHANLRQAEHAAESAREAVGVEAERIAPRIKAATQKVAKLTKAFETTLGAVDPWLRAQVERIAGARDGVATAAMRGGVCRGCHHIVPPQVAAQVAAAHITPTASPTQCPNCGRILLDASTAPE